MFEPAVPDCLIISIFLACKGISRQIAGIKEPAVWFLRCLESQKGFDRHKIPVVVKQKHMISQGSDPTVHRFSDGNLFFGKTDDRSERISHNHHMLREDKSHFLSFFRLCRTPYRFESPNGLSQKYRILDYGGILVKQLKTR